MIELPDKKISKAILTRLPIYLRSLRNHFTAGEEIISSTVLADELDLNPVQVRKDLASVSSKAGKPRMGFNIAELINDITIFLGYDAVKDAILVGAGGLGKTLLSYSGFEKYGLNILMAFDTNEYIINREVNGKKILNLSKMQEIIKRLNIKLGIITVPKQYAQQICDLMIASGIKGIWNFAPTAIKVPDNIAIKNEDMAASLAILSNKLTVLLKEENKTLNENNTDISTENKNKK